MDNLSKPIDEKILNSEYEKSIGMNNYGNLNHVGRKEVRGGRRKSDVGYFRRRVSMMNRTWL